MKYHDIGHMTMLDMKKAIDALGGIDGIVSYMGNAGCRKESIVAVMDAVRDTSAPRRVELWWTENAMSRIMRSDGYAPDQTSRNHYSPARKDDARCCNELSWWRGRIDHDMKMISMVIGGAYESTDNMIIHNEIEKARERVVSRLKSLHPDYSVYCFDVGTANGVLAS